MEITIDAATLRQHHALFLAFLQLFTIACRGGSCLLMLSCVDLIQEHSQLRLSLRVYKDLRRFLSCIDPLQILGDVGGSR